jgi:hypothetical protein
LRPWWEQFEGRLEWELGGGGGGGRGKNPKTARILASGVPDGKIVVKARFETSRGDLELFVHYPASFPFLRPLVVAPQLQLANHQNPFAKNLCLLDQDTRNWLPQQSAAAHIAEQLPKLFLAVDGTAEERESNETSQAEPFSAFIPNERNGAVFIPSQALGIDQAEQRGAIRLRLLQPLDARANNGIRALLALVATSPARGSKRRLAVAESELLATGAGTLDGRFLRVPLDAASPPAAPDAAAFADYAHTIDPEWASPTYKSVAGGDISVLGLVFSEEVVRRDREDTWVFLIRTRARMPPRTGWQEASYLVKGQRLARVDLTARIPELRALEGKTVALAGVGALGGPLALELARAQLRELRLLDCDLVEIGNSVRWPLGLPAAGALKTATIGAFIRDNYPLVTVRPHHLQVGNPFDARERTVLTEFLAGADLVISATAEYGIEHLISALTLDSGQRQVYAAAGRGYWGGLVARVVPGQTGCWTCLKLWHAQQGEGRIPAAASDPSQPPQPRGCAARASTGAAFDMLPIVAQAARVAAQTLVHDVDGGYPRAPGDVWRMTLRTKEGPLPAPNWETFLLPKHPDCFYCQPSTS